MVEWININTSKISRIAYNSKINTMYIDFPDSTLDVPYKDVAEEVFIEFSQAKNVDEYYENNIKDTFERVVINTKNQIDCKL